MDLSEIAMRKYSIDFLTKRSIKLLLKIRIFELIIKFVVKSRKTKSNKIFLVKISKIVNFVRFCEVLVKSAAPVKQIELVTTAEPVSRRFDLEFD